MRPSTAITRLNQNTATRSIWKKYQSIKGQKNKFYCFKTITQILQGHQNKPERPLKQQKNDYYYQKLNQPQKSRQNAKTIKESNSKKTNNIIERNPTMKKVLSNNFFSSKEIGKQNVQKINFTKTKTQNEIKIQTSAKFLPYRQQALSIIKQSKILNEAETDQKIEAQCQIKKSKQTLKQQNHLAQNKKTTMKQRNKYKNLMQHSKTLKYEQLSSNEQNFYDEFVINQWQNLEDQNSNMTFSMLINNGNNKKKSS